MNQPPYFRKLNLITGWVVFSIALLVYTLTLEPTASFWDCGEYIACAWGLETGHPPGAPFFLLLGRVFGLLSFGDVSRVAWWINFMSGAASAATVLFLFWTITHFARKTLLRYGHDFSQTRVVLIMIAGMCGALSYAFTDSFWFSAVEGEVYALSSFFTAAVFWAILKWEEEADEVTSDRWIVFIAALIGMSIGVHLLNLLTIPALVFTWYFRKHPVFRWKNFLLAGILALIMLGGIQDVLIPGIVKLAGKSELFFVNQLGWSFNAGIIFFFAALILLITAGLIVSVRKRIRWLNTALLSLSVLLIGYSSFLVIVIRANAGTPINENDPSDPVSLLSYLNREQYGDWPLLYGQQYNTPLDSKEPYIDGEPVYVKDEASGRYIISDDRKKDIANYDKRGCVFFPRMWSSGHATAYTNWVGIEGTPVDFSDENGKSATVNIPTFAENMKFFVSYQTGWMYLRYFMWNFVGRQNDHAGYGNDLEGNWMSGISFIDDPRSGDHKLMPDLQKRNKASNHYFFLPLLMGVAGFIWQYNRARKDAFVISLLFLFTGLSIVVYLNQTPWQPRERDYAYVGSFYAFSIWIGLGTLLIYEARKYIRRTIALVSAVSVSSVIPSVLLIQNWDDHDRSGRTVAEDLAVSMLESCRPNAILFTYADNDTFPLWYAQEVLGVRKDVRIICLSLFRSDWYIDQAKRKQYDADPLPIAAEQWQYREGTRDYISIFAEQQDTFMLADVVAFMKSELFEEKYESIYGDTLNFIPARTVKLPVDGSNDTLIWSLRGGYLLKDQWIILDMLSNFQWKRPVHFAVNMPQSCYSGLDEYLELEGLTYHLTATRNQREGGDLFDRPQVNLKKTYELFTTRFKWGGLANEDVYADETVQRMFSDPYRFSCAVTAEALAESGMNEQASTLVRLCTDNIPAHQVLPDNYWIILCNAAWMSGDNQLANRIADQHFRFCVQSVVWYRTFNPERMPGDYSTRMQQLQTLWSMAESFGQMSIMTEWKNLAEKYNIALTSGL